MCKMAAILCMIRAQKLNKMKILRAMESKFTIGGPEDNEELLTQAAAPQHQMSVAAATMSGSDAMEYVVGHNNGAMIGAMGVQPDLNNSMGFAFNHSQQLVTNLQREQEDINGEYGALHHGGIYKRSSMNLTSMNHMISKLIRKCRF
eukprot:178087_1